MFGVRFIVRKGESTTSLGSGGDPGSRGSGDEYLALLPRSNEHSKGELISSVHACITIGYIEPVEADDLLQDDEETKGRKDRPCLRERGGGGYETHAENKSEPARPPRLIVPNIFQTREQQQQRVFEGG